MPILEGDLFQPKGSKQILRQTPQGPVGLERPEEIGGAAIKPATVDETRALFADVDRIADFDEFARSQNLLSPVVTTDGLRDEVQSAGLEPADVIEEEDEGFLGDIQGRFDESDALIESLVDLQGPTIEEQNLEGDIQEIEQMLQAEVEGVEERALDATILKSGMANEINNIVRGDTRKALVLMRRMNNLNQKLARLQGNREAQQNALKLEFDLRRQSTQDALAFYQLTAPDQVAEDPATGQIWFRNPITGEVTVTELPEFEEGRATSFETRNVGGRTIRFGFDARGNEVSRTDLGRTTGVQDTGTTPEEEEEVSDEVRTFAERLNAGQITVSNVPSALRGEVLAEAKKLSLADLDEDIRLGNESADNLTREQIIEQLVGAYPEFSREEIRNRVFELIPDQPEEGGAEEAGESFFNRIFNFEDTNLRPFDLFRN